MNITAKEIIVVTFKWIGTFVLAWVVGGLVLSLLCVIPEISQSYGTMARSSNIILNIFVGVLAISAYKSLVRE